MDGSDLRALLDPLAAIRGARPRYRDEPETTWTPPATDADPDPEPVVTPARREFFVAPDQLPDPVVEGDGVDLGAQLALVQAAVARLGDFQLLGVHAARTFTSTLIWTAGQTRDVDLTWETTPLAPCRYATVRMDVGVAWQGKLSAAIAPGSVTDTGCTVRVTATAAVVITAGMPLTVHADGTYLYWPPYEEGT